MPKQFQNFIIGSHLENASSFHDKTKIRLLFNIANVLAILGLIATIVSLIIGTYPILIPAAGNIGLSLMVMFILKFKNYKVAGAIYFAALACLLFGNLIFNKGTMHIGSPFWIAILIIVTYYIIGKVWGTIYFAISCICFCYYILIVFPITLEIVGQLPSVTYYSALYETVFVLFILSYIISTILSASKKSGELLMTQNHELTLQNEQIRVRDQEKSLLLKEIHHRVKNNLQVVISLMRLQMNSLKNEDFSDKYNETINRVLTMSKIHEKIYQSESLSQVNLNQYFVDLSHDLINSFKTDFEIELSYNFEIEKIGLKTIVPLALIFNELFSNSIKHAFDNTSQPKITLNLKKIDAQTFSFCYHDNGEWKDSESDETFGKDLIDALTTQLEGELKFENHNETKYNFTFTQLDF